MANAFRDKLRAVGNALVDTQIPYDPYFMSQLDPEAHPTMRAGDAGEFLESYTPYGNYVSARDARDARDDFAEGDYGWGTFNALAALPGLGMIKGPGRAWRRTAARSTLLRNHPETNATPQGLFQTDQGAFMRADSLADYALSRGLKSPTLDKLVAEIENKLKAAKPYETPDSIKAFEDKIKAANERIETAANLRETRQFERERDSLINEVFTLKYPHKYKRIISQLNNY